MGTAADAVQREQCALHSHLSLNRLTLLWRFREAPKSCYCLRTPELCVTNGTGWLLSLCVAYTTCLRS